VSPDWRIRSAYTLFEMDFEVDPSSFESTFIDDKDGLVPEHHVNVRSYYDIDEHWEVNTAVYWVSDLEFFDSPAYWRWDLNVGWKPTSDLRLAIGAQNITEDQHAEAGEDILTYGGEVPRSFFIDFRASF
jgi:iron complex outermembrane receptor protein